MSLIAEEPGWLWVLGVALPLTVVGAGWFRAMGGARRWTSVVVRLALVAVLVAMLAGVGVWHASDRRAVVVAVDLSGSMARAPGGEAGVLRDVGGFVAKAMASRGPDDVLGVVVFDGRAEVASRVSRVGAVASGLAAPGVRGTNIAGAIRLARAMMPQDASGRVVLVSDGLETIGDARTAAGEMEDGRRVSVDVVAVRGEVGEETAVEALDVPASEAEGGTVAVRAVVRATGVSRGTLRVEENGRQAAAARGEVGPGARVFRLDVPLAPGKTHRLRAVWEPDVVEDGSGGVRLSGDTLTQNNASEGFVVTPGRGSVMVVGQAGSELAAVLRETGWEVREVTPGGVPSDMADLVGFDLIVLDDVSAGWLGEPAQQRLAAYVTQCGGGLVMSGGPSSFAPGGWVGSTLEPLLPVELRVPDVVVRPQSATVLVLDNSGSMSRMVAGTGRSQQELANRAAALAVRAVAPSDLVGVITFNSEAEVVVPLARVGDGAGVVREIEAISPGGGTNAGPALELARDELRRAAGDVKVRHVVLLTDGVSRDKELLPGVVQRLVAEGARVTTIAVGDGADVAELGGLAKQGGGGFFYAMNAGMLPQVLLDAVRVVKSPLIVEEPTPVEVMAGAMTDGLGDVPPLAGLVMTRARTLPTVTTAIRSARGDPVLAAWPVGLGRVAAWTSDAGAWSASWRASGAFRRLWVQLARGVARADGAGDLRVEMAAEDGSLRVTGRMGATPDADNVAVSARVFGADGQAREVRLVPRGPGLFEGRIDAWGPGMYVGVVRSEVAGRARAAVAGAWVADDAEFGTVASDGALLSAVAGASGGRARTLADVEGLWARDPGPPRGVAAPLWKWLLPWAVVLFMVDVAVRRVAWDRWLVPEGAGRVNAAGAAATASRLRSTLEQAPGDAPAIALGEAEARALAKRARELRAARRAGGGEVGEVGGAKPGAARGEGLMEAKRRARREYEEGEK